MNDIRKKIIRAIYKEGINFLLSFEEIDKDILEVHLKSEYNKPRNIKDIYYVLCGTAQEKQMSSKIIGNSIGGVINLKKVLYNFDPYKVKKMFSKFDSRQLLDKIVKDLKPSGKIRKTNKSIWPQYCQTLIDSAYFLAKFPNADEFYNWVNKFVNDNNTKIALPIILSFEISGIGFPLACNFLKEIGYQEFGKPDVHLKDVFKELKIISDSEKSTTRQDYLTFKSIEEIAIINNVTPYAVDRVIWLIGSGYFYKSDIKIGNNKKLFVEFMKTKYKI